MTESGPEMAVGDAGWAEQQDVLPALDPGSARARKRALPIIGTAAKSKASKVLPGGRRDSCAWRAMRRCRRSATACSASAARKRTAGQLSASAVSAKLGHMRAKVGRRSSVSRIGNRAASTAMVAPSRFLRRTRR